jgi:hypothetical protein
MGRPKNIENMTQEERIVYWEKRREREAFARLETFNALSADQRQAVKDLYDKLDSVLDTVLYPENGGIKYVTAFELQELADANDTLRFNFNLDVRENG